MGKPLPIAPARAWRTYEGGSLIAALHGEQAQDTHFPEEWILSTVAARNPGREHIVEGLSCTRDGRSLRDVIAQDPEGMLGKGRRETGMLMKLIDASQRLAVQVHPTRTDAQRLFHSPFGKTECWHILGGRTLGGQPPHIYFGFREGVTREKWSALFYRQDIPGMLACLHRMEVQPGETYLIPGGVPHAIGAGCFLAEIQEPTDLTLRTERTGIDGSPLPDQSCHQGAGFDNMLSCFDYTGLSLAAARRRWCLTPRMLSEEAGQYRRTALVDYDHTPYFRMERIEVTGAMPFPPSDSYSGLYVLEGQGTLTCQGEQAALGRGDQYFVPADCAPAVLKARSPLILLRYQGPKEP